MQAVESAGIGRTSTRRRAIAILFGLLGQFFAETVVLGQTPLHTIPFPGGVTLEWKRDEMADRKRCSIFTPTLGMYAGVYGDDTVSFWIPEAAPLVSGQRPALARIGSNPPIRLQVGDKPRHLGVRKGDGRQVVKALYRRSKIVVRYYSFPEQDERNMELTTIGDVALAYNYAVKHCGWRSLAIERTPLSKEPHVYKGEEGGVSATFGGDGGWHVVFLPEDQWCSVSTVYARTIFRSFHGRPDQILPLGAVTFYRPGGGIVTTLKHDTYSPGPIAEFMRALEEAGEYGWVDMGKGGPASLYGLSEALRYAEQTCGVTLR